MEERQTLVQAIQEYGALGYQRGLALGSGGNISCRWNQGMLITRSGSCLGRLATEDILAVDFQGRLLDSGTGTRPSIETGFHAAVYQKRPEVNCVYHTHATYCTYWALLGQCLPLVSSVARMLLGPIPLVPYGEPGSGELARAVGETLDRYPGCRGLLLTGHGAVTWGPSPEDAFSLAELMEQTAHLAYLLESRGSSREE